MSHFAVLVIGPNYNEQLAPYHEFECTGQVDQWVQSIDETEEARASYESETDSIIILPDGTRVAANDPQFYRDPTAEEQEKMGPFGGTGWGKGISYTSRDWGDGKGYRTKVYDATLGGGTLTEVPVKETKTFSEFCQEYYERPVVAFGEEPDLEETHKWGWLELGAEGEVVKVVDRTNPNRKWDWYIPGGRWTGYFPLKPGATGEVGKPGLMTEAAEPGTADQCLWGDVDLGKARGEAAERARETFAGWAECLLDNPKPRPWGEVLASMPEDIDKAREVYNEQKAIASWKEKNPYSWGCPVEDLGFDEEGYVAKKRSQALVPFSIVKDGKWHQKGRMGWWGMTSDEMPEGEWETQVAALFDDLPPDTPVTMVDCHI